MFEFQDRVAVITGAAGGIGKAMAERFAQAGMKLVLSDVDGHLLEDAVGALRATGAEVVGIVADVAREEEIAALADAAYDKFGSVDLLCNNAGVVPSGRHRPVWEFPVEDWHWAIGVNIMGVVHGLRSFVPRMLEQGTPSHIVNTASIAGLVTGTKSPLYGMTKHAVVRITEGLHAALVAQAAPISVTLLCPGLVSTDIFLSERNRPQDFLPADMEVPLQDGPATDIGDMKSPNEVAEMVFAAVQHRQFYLLTSEAFDDDIRERCDAILARGGGIL